MTDVQKNTTPPGSGLEAGDWTEIEDRERYALLGFLQMCIERRFHKAIQQRFESVTGLGPTDYWIHADVGGSPKMRYQEKAPDYCSTKVRFMGWSAHGSTCGGFRAGDSDEFILAQLKNTLQEKVKKYPGITHHGFFAYEARSSHVMVLHLTPTEPG